MSIIEVLGEWTEHMGKNEETHILEFTEEELKIMAIIFTYLSKKSLGKWLSFIKQGKYGSIECSLRWHITGKYSDIQYKTRKALGFKAPENETL